MPTDWRTLKPGDKVIWGYFEGINSVFLGKSGIIRDISSSGYNATIELLEDVGRFKAGETVNTTPAHNHLRPAHSNHISRRRGDTHA